MWADLVIAALFDAGCPPSVFLWAWGEAGPFDGADGHPFDLKTFRRSWSPLLLSK